MIEDIFVFESTRRRQREAPLFKEREQYLSHLLKSGIDVRRVRSVAATISIATPPLLRDSPMILLLRERLIRSEM